MALAFPRHDIDPSKWHLLPGCPVQASADALILPHAEKVDLKETWYFHEAVSAFDVRNSSGETRKGEMIPKVPKASHGFIYAAAYEGTKGLVKIGESRSFPTRRLADLTSRTAAPSQLKMLFAMETPFRNATEKSAHDALVPRHSKGEWFSLSADELVHFMFGLAAIHEWRRYGWRLWATPDLLGRCSADAVRVLCAAGMGEAPSSADHMYAPAHSISVASPSMTELESSAPSMTAVCSM